MALKTVITIPDLSIYCRLYFTRSNLKRFILNSIQSTHGSFLVDNRREKIKNTRYKLEERDPLRCLVNRHGKFSILFSSYFQNYLL